MTGEQKISNLEIIEENKIPVKIGGKVRNLFYNFTAISRLQKSYTNTDEMFDALGSGNVDDIVRFLWAGFIHEDPELTEEEVGSWCGFSNIPQIMILIYKAINGAKVSENEKEDTQEEASGIEANEQSKKLPARRKSRKNS